ncbi:MAG: 3-hydroxyacyl-CoA dehydrogenase family protein [Candidatus Thermoplasmatota archaeon]|jgi:3-hydroxybutyryl-CoA dehydrogenase|nr:3-hydroxyacyl-CoA dehydrogenase family protein [Candidatus Thermoplasmatota archaeon]
MEIKKVGIVGAGAMGSGIAEVLILNGVQVIIKDQNIQLAEKGRENVRKYLKEMENYTRNLPEREIKRMERFGVDLSPDQVKKLRESFPSPPDVEKLIEKLKVTDTFEDFRDVDLVIEAVFEDQGVKNKLFREISDFLKDNAIMASNTSSLNITEMASHYKHPEKAIVIHFFNPAYLMPLVEVVPALQTDESVVTSVMEFFSGKRNNRENIVTIRARESPGFVVNRILIPMITEAVKVVESGVADYRTVDIGMKKGAGMPMGPFELADYVGIDILYHVMESFRRDLGDFYMPPRTIKQLVDAGWIGMKSGKGFYDHREK